MTVYHPQTPESQIYEDDDISFDQGFLNSRRPLVCRWPEGREPKAVVIFCHGLGAYGGEYAELSRHWARNGYLVIHPTFSDWIKAVASEEPELGLDPEADNRGWSANPALRNRMHEILHDPARWLERIKLVRSVVDLKDEIVSATCGKLDRSIPIAIAGHSFGAFVAQVLAGAVIDLPGQSSVSFRDDRFAAAVLLSAQGRDQQGLRNGSWDAIAMPLINITGTLDRGAKGGDWHWKCEPYELAPSGQKYLAVLQDADHYLGMSTTSGQNLQASTHLSAVKQLTSAFLDSHLANDATATTWLASLSDHVGDCQLLFKRK
jgi:predicted dienelactone hydrolase